MTRLPPDYHRRRRGPRRGDDYDDYDDDAMSGSARRDEVARLTSTKSGRAKLVLSSAAAGYGIGTFLARSTLPRGAADTVGPASAALFATLTFLRNDYGELSKSLGAALVLVAGRAGGVRRRYPTKSHLKSMLAMGRRTPFPPLTSEPDDEGVVNENPWTYRPRARRDLPPDAEGPDPEFSMIKCAIAAAAVGGICGSDLPLIPSWMGAAGGAAALAFLSTLRSARGDLARTAGMRVVAILTELLEVNNELGVAGKAATVGGKIFDRVMILDRKHRIKDRLTAGMAWAFDKAQGAVKQVRSDMEERRG
uniref:Uncharacterized protein n=1 Tax=Trieres chinensis TaxID=1514140 RepID=A0A7S2A8I8_TRICV|mmetsp:Transcript_6971/g.14631  ORF Transcript_6971/g.14631 Transcript_6971/m.14631 type:complete len:308 (+) Transcript_6971:188-1111(+)